MKLATRKDDSRDGQLVVVSRDLKHAVMASRITGTLQRALDDWAFMAPQLQDLYDELNHGRAPNSFPFDPDEYLSPLPRAFQRIEAGAYPAYEKRLQKARLVADAPLPEDMVPLKIAPSPRRPIRTTSRTRGRRRRPTNTPRPRRRAHTAWCPFRMLPHARPRHARRQLGAGWISVRSWWPSATICR